jgi:uncharacterized repeat protein (TIGR01451 family)
VPLHLEYLEQRELLTTFTVLNTNDSGTDSLRDAITKSNTAGGTNIIVFNITGTGVQTINLASALPTITVPVTINGFSQPGTTGTPTIELRGTNAGAGANGLTIAAGNSTIEGLTINAFKGNGIVLSGIGGNTITGNFIGVDAAGTGPLSNSGDGILINGSPNNIIGNTATNGRNVISSNTGNGVHIEGGASMNNLIQNNAIGADTTGASSLPNQGDGVLIDSGTNNTIGGTVGSVGNVIAFNNGAGVDVATGTGNTIRHNSIFNNTGHGIILGSGANNNQPAPTISVVTTTSGTTTVQGSIKAAANTTYNVDFFSNTSVDPSGFGQGRTFVGGTTVTTDNTGNGKFTANTTSAVALNNFVASTATDNSGNTSEFSNNGLNIAPTAALTMTGAGTPNPVAAGGFLNYTFTITNGGPSTATNVMFSDTLPSGFTFVMATSTQGNITQSGGVVTGTLNSLNANTTATVTIQVVPATSNIGNVSNTGTVTATESTGGASATVTTQVVQGIDLAINASSSPNPAIINQNVVLQFVVTNNGPATATNVKFSDQLPTTLTFVSATTSSGPNVIQSGGLVGASLPNLATGQSATVSITATPTVSGTISNTANVRADQTEINPPNNTVTQQISVSAVAPPPIASDGPLVTNLARFGSHTQRTNILVSFNTPLNATSALNGSNYTLRVVGGHHRILRISAINYDPVTRQVRILPTENIPLWAKIQLTINGTTSTGVTDLNGRLLDGARTGQPGSNFVMTFSGYGPGRIG